MLRDAVQGVCMNDLMTQQHALGPSARATREIHLLGRRMQQKQATRAQNRGAQGLLATFAEELGHSHLGPAAMTCSKQASGT